MREARRAYGELELEEVEALGRRAFVPRGLEPAPPHVRLLPAFDGFLLGHRDRALIMREEHDKAVLPGGGILAATLVVDGLIEGTWKLDRSGRPDVTPFAARRISPPRSRTSSGSGPGSLDRACTSGPGPRRPRARSRPAP